MLNIVLFGPPGAGKGTQSEKLISHYNLEHISTGDLLRNEIKNNTDLGLQAKTLMDQGKLVPDHVVVGMIGHKLDAKPGATGFIFDGFPRTVAQAISLDELLTEHQSDITLMIGLEVEVEELIHRLVERGKTSGRADDNEETIRKRIAVYQSETSPVADYYKGQDKYFRVEGIGEVEEIFNRICSVINSHLTVNS